VDSEIYGTDTKALPPVLRAFGSKGGFAPGAAICLLFAVWAPLSLSCDALFVFIVFGGGFFCFDFAARSSSYFCAGFMPQHMTCEGIS